MSPEAHLAVSNRPAVCASTPVACSHACRRQVHHAVGPPAAAAAGDCATILKALQQQLHVPCLALPSLPDGCREKKGFLTEQRRFSLPEDDNPGPGTYVAQAPSLEYKHESISKKGYGSMISKARRFKGQRPAYTGPGPGEYNARLLPPALDFNKAPLTAAFRSKVGQVGEGGGGGGDGGAGGRRGVGLLACMRAGCGGGVGA